MGEQCEKLQAFLKRSEKNEERLLKSQEKLLKSRLTLIRQEEALIVKFLLGNISKDVFFEEDKKLKEKINNVFEISDEINITLKKAYSHTKELQEKIKNTCSP